ncbi:putative reverse transcriptase domain-containing protein [Tanacetum coccineum]
MQGRALTCWNTLVQTRGWAATIAQSWDDFKKLLMEEYYPDDEVQKLELEFWNHKMVGSDIDGYTARFHELAKLVPHMVTPERKCGAVSMANRLTTDGIKDRLFKKKENTGNKRRLNDQNRNRGRDDRNKRERTREYFGLTILEQGRAANERPRPTCFDCGDPNHFRRNCLRMNRATTSGGNCPNPVLAIKGNTNQGNNMNQALGKAFALGVVEAPQDPNVVMGTFSLNDHFATVLFDSGADYSFISTNFLPLIDMKPCVISPGYEIEIASGLKVETNKIVRGCRLQLEGHTFITDLIPFGHGSFDMIVGMDWLSKLRAKIVCFDKIVQIPLSNGEILEVHGEHAEGNLKQLKTMKVNEPKLKDIPVIHDFPGVFPEDLSGLPPSREVEFHIDLIPGAMSVAKSPYRLAPTEMQELSNQLKELKEKDYRELNKLTNSKISIIVLLNSCVKIPHLHLIFIIQDQGPTSGNRANRGTLNKKNHKITNKHSPTILHKMSQPANDEFSQHLSDDEESNHEDASDTGAAPKQQQQVIQNGNSKKRISTGKDGIVRILSPVTALQKKIQEWLKGKEGLRISC